MSYIDKINTCNHYNLHDFLPIILNKKQIGWVYPSFAKHLSQWPELFDIKANQVSIISNKTTTPQSLSKQIAPILSALHNAHIIDSWVGEDYPVVQQFNDPAQFYIERAATTYLGIRSFGIHINGLVEKDEGLYVWIATRTKSKPFWPGKYDQIVAGGQPAHLGLMENVIKESQEEANISEALAMTSHYQGALHYCHQSKRGLSPDTLFIYDLYLPKTFTPLNTDGEVESFQLIPIQQLAELTEHTNTFKDNCNLVNIDLLLRKNIISSKHPHYKAIKQSLYIPPVTTY